MEKLIIIGSGPAGLTAAIYAARANLSPLVIAGYQSGGQLMLTTEVENFPGFKEGIMGPDLMNQMREQALKFGTKFIDKDCTKVDFTDVNNKRVFIDDVEYKAQSIIIATGASARWLNVPGEKELIGRGVSSCATCDGAFYKEKIVAVIGGGDSAMEEASFLTRFAKRVYIIHRRNEFKASKIMQQRILQNPKIEVIWNQKIKEIKGSSNVESLVLENSETMEETSMNIDGVFVAIGHDPNTHFLKGHLELDEKGYIKQRFEDSIEDKGSEIGSIFSPETLTSVTGVFVSGDVYDIRYRQAITAAGSGCKAALDAEKFLESLEMSI